MTLLHAKPPEAVCAFHVSYDWFLLYVRTLCTHSLYLLYFTFHSLWPSACCGSERRNGIREFIVFVNSLR